MEKELIPGLPEDIARQCLIRVPFHRFGPIRSVCRLWKQEVESKLFHTTRSASRLTRLVIALAHAEPAACSSGPAHKYHHSASTPSYRLTLFDPSAATWQPLPPIPGLPNGLPLFCQVAAVGREILVIGGWDPETWAPSDCVYVYDLAAATWREGARMPGPKRSFFACAAGSGPGRVVFVAGGHDDEKNALRSALAYDVENDTWAPIPDMARDRDECKGVFLRGRFHVIGGYPTESQGRFEKSAEAFDLATWRWGPVEEDVLDAAASPRTCVAGADGRLFMCRNGQVAVKEGSGWGAVADLPEDAGVAPALVAWQGRVIVMGSGSHGGAVEAYVTEVGRRVTWQKVEVAAEYSGHVQTACCLEI